MTGVKTGDDDNDNLDVKLMMISGAHICDDDDVIMPQHHRLCHHQHHRHHHHHKQHRFQ